MLLAREKTGRGGMLLQTLFAGCTATKTEPAEEQAYQKQLVQSKAQSRSDADEVGAAMNTVENEEKLERSAPANGAPKGNKKREVTRGRTKAACGRKNPTPQAMAEEPLKPEEELAAPAAVEKEESVDTPTSAAGSGKRKRGPAKGNKAKDGSGRKKSSSETTAENPLRPDEEFAALAALAAQSRKFVGAHISAAGGVHNALLNCFDVKGKSSCFHC